MMTNNEDALLLQRQNYPDVFGHVFKEMKNEEEFFDVTLISGDNKHVRAHKVIISACSPWFRDVLNKMSHPNPVLYLKGVSAPDLNSLLEYMYAGEVNVLRSNMVNLLAIAEDLMVTGLYDPKAQSNNSTLFKNNSPKEVDDVRNDISVEEMGEKTNGSKSGPSVTEECEDESEEDTNGTSISGTGQIEGSVNDVSVGNGMEKLERSTVTSTPIKQNISPYFLPEKANPKTWDTPQTLETSVKVLANRKRGSSEKENHVPQSKKQKEDNLVEQDYENVKEELDNDDLEVQMEKLFENNSDVSLPEENESGEVIKKWKPRICLNSRNDSQIDDSLYVATCKGEPIDVQATIAKIEEKKLVLENRTDQEEFKDNIESLIVRLKHEKKVVYRCAVCNKTLKLKVHIASHIEANHVRGVAHQCNTCNSVFKTRATLKIHKTKMHENPSSSEGTLQNRQ